ncbi:NAD-dependent epimerase/dehydratase family protein [Meiothermus hypogaeus]|uniref:NAD-dependent epimerase n=2 Tax=Meiothermus hypogaeus TaxID=884155 RepID=A0A511R5D5_9DEIN|nr:NAD-dependent epimerase/dehydratase family protein [Meiothermus hypogaeus]RIH74723.1 NAD dependent epimerase/dehydratase [Meiothermus hypogaeus]GEM84829.1 NAD-dependent epimerase [Meiothermus hypogaeus NBRC 106114]
MKELHVIFGTGPLGCSVAEELIKRNKAVRMISRSGQAGVPGVETVAGDALSLEFTRRITDGAAVVYQCAQPAYHRWAEEFPALQASILEGAAANKARLVIADNLYMYGDPNGQPINEESPQNPTSKKGKVRKAMADAALATHQAGRLQVALSRPSHYFGPGYKVTGNMVFKKALSGQAMQFLGRLDQPHSFSYVPDAGRAMAVLGTSEQGWGQVWIPPVQPTLTQLEFAQKIWQSAGQTGKPKVQALSRFMTQLAGLFIPTIRETVEMLYEFEKPYVVDASRFERTFGVKATPMDEAIRLTLEHYRQTVPLKQTA